jgi:hypothetical protein
VKALHFNYSEKEGLMKSKVKPMKKGLVGTYESLKAASKQVDLLLRGNSELCVNIVRNGSKFQVQAVVWQ